MPDFTLYGVVIVFDTRKEAEERATFLNIQMNNAYAVACFEYHVQEAQ